MNRRDFLQTSAGAALAFAGAPMASHAAISGIAGQRYSATVPDTLDLVDSALIGINGLTRSLDADADYEIYSAVQFAAKPPFMVHWKFDFECQGKWWESMATLRAVTGSDLNRDIEEKFSRAMLSHQADDGLFYTGVPRMMPWHEANNAPLGKGHSYKPCGEPYANPVGNGRALLAMLIYYQHDNDPVWLKRIQKNSDGMSRMVVEAGDYAYFPDGGCGTAFSYPMSGWKSRAEPPGEHYGGEGTTLGYTGTAIRALTRWYTFSGDEKALAMATKLVNFSQQQKMWDWWEGTPPNDVDVAGQGHFQGHFHGHTMYLRALLDYAIATENDRWKEFVRSSYEYARSKGIARLGCFGEGCTVADMIALAIRLSDAGVGDYWDDVSHYVRNEFVEMQFTRREDLEAASEHYKDLSAEELKGRDELVYPIPGLVTTDHVIGRSLGMFSCGGNPTQSRPTAALCCVGNCTNAIYYAWESIVRNSGTSAQVNLLLNRASPGLDVESHLPYEGKVVLRTKGVEKVAVRVPSWVNRKNLRFRVNASDAAATWVGNYASFSGLKAGDMIQADFAVPEEAAVYTRVFSTPPLNSASSEKYVCKFKGDTCLEVTGPDDYAVGYPAYRNRAHFSKTEAPVKTAQLYVAPKLYSW